MFYVNVTCKPKTQGWAIYIFYTHEIVVLLLYRNKDFTYCKYSLATGYIQHADLIIYEKESCR